MPDRASDPFARPRTPAELVVALTDDCRHGTVVRPVWSHPYPECFVRLTLAFPEEHLAYTSDPASISACSPLFWETGTPAQVLLWCSASGMEWILSLTRWGVLRWECRQPGQKKALAFLESASPLPTLVPLDQPACVGVTMSLRPDGQTEVRLLAGHADGHLAQLSHGTWTLPKSSERAAAIRLGQGPRRLLPTQARLHALLVAQTECHPIYRGHGRTTPGCSTGHVNASGLACRIDDATILAYPGVDYDSTTGNYWHNITITDQRVRTVRFARHCGMSTRCFGSLDGRHWNPLPGTAIPGENHDAHALQVDLPRRRGPIQLANSPVYDEAARDRDLKEVRALGASVHVVATSRGGLPVHAVRLGRGPIGIALICGQHSPLEQMTGFLGLPMMQEFARLGLHEQLSLYWVPICNIDCTRRAWSGRTLDGANPNRCWFANRGPEQRGIQAFFTAETRRGTRLGLMLDAHGGGIWRNHTLLTNYQIPHARLERALRAGRIPRLGGTDRLKHAWLPLLDRHAGLGELWRNGISGPVLNGAPHWFQHALGCPAMTVECSVSSQRDPASRRIVPFTQEGFGDIGRHLSQAFAAGMELLRTGSSSHAHR